MSPVKAFGYVALWLLLTGYYFAFEREGAEEDGREVAETSFLDLHLADVHAVELQSNERRLRCVRDGQGWRAVEPAGVTVPSDLIATIVATLTATADVEVVDPDGSRAQEFGFDEPRGQFVLVPAEGAPVSVSLGARNPAQTAVYARRAGSPAIVLLGLNIDYYLDLALARLG